MFVDKYPILEQQKTCICGDLYFVFETSVASWLLTEGVWNDASKNIGVPAWYLAEPLWSVGSKLYSKKKCYRCLVGDQCNREIIIRFGDANS